MENKDIKALFIVVNAGFSEEAINIARAAGAGGATILNSRGEGATHKSVLGITVDFEKEMVLSLVQKSVADKIMGQIKEKMGIRSPANGICFTMPVENLTEINLPSLDEEDDEDAEQA